MNCPNQFATVLSITFIIEHVLNIIFFLHISKKYTVSLLSTFEKQKYKDYLNLNFNFIFKFRCNIYSLSLFKPHFVVKQELYAVPHPIKIILFVIFRLIGKFIIDIFLTLSTYLQFLILYCLKI